MRVCGAVLTTFLCRLRVCLDTESPDEHIPPNFPPPSLCTGK